MSTTRFATLALLVASTASANVVATGAPVAPTTTVIVQEREPEKPMSQRIEGRLSMLLGGADVGDADGFSVGVSAGLGYRIGDATVRALFDYYRVGDSDDELNVRRGRGTRLGGAVRYSFANNNPDYEKTGNGIGLDFWGELGMGYEHVAWREGGVLERPSGEIAIGFDLDVYGKRRGNSNRRKHLGYFMAFRTQLARGPEMDGPAVCGGPCTMATKPSRIDTTMFFEMGLHWGR